MTERISMDTILQVAMWSRRQTELQGRDTEKNLISANTDLRNGVKAREADLVRHDV